MRLPIRSSLMILTGVIIAALCFAGEKEISPKEIPEKVKTAFEKTYPRRQRELLIEPWFV